MATLPGGTEIVLYKWRARIIAYRNSNTLCFSEHFYQFALFELLELHILLAFSTEKSSLLKVNEESCNMKSFLQSFLPLTQKSTRWLYHCTPCDEFRSLLTVLSITMVTGFKQIQQHMPQMLLLENLLKIIITYWKMKKNPLLQLFANSIHQSSVPFLCKSSFKKDEIKDQTNCLGKI